MLSHVCHIVPCGNICGNLYSIVHTDHTTAWPKQTVYCSAKCRQAMDSAVHLEGSLIRLVLVRVQG